MDMDIQIYLYLNHKCVVDSYIDDDGYNGHAHTGHNGHNGHHGHARNGSDRGAFGQVVKRDEDPTQHIEGKDKHPQAWISSVPATAVDDAVLALPISSSRPVHMNHGEFVEQPNADQDENEDIGDNIYTPETANTLAVDLNVNEADYNAPVPDNDAISDVNNVGHGYPGYADDDDDEKETHRSSLEMNTAGFIDHHAGQSQHFDDYDLEHGTMQ